MSSVRLLTLDDVKARLERHISLRLREIEPAEAVVTEAVREVCELAARSEAEAVISSLRRGAEELRSSEVSRWLEAASNGCEPSREQLDSLTRSIVSKLLEDPLDRLREAAAGNGEGELMLQTARELFGADEQANEAPQSTE